MSNLPGNREPSLWNGRSRGPVHRKVQRLCREEPAQYSAPERPAPYQLAEGGEIVQGAGKPAQT